MKRMTRHHFSRQTLLSTALLVTCSAVAGQGQPWFSAWPAEQGQPWLSAWPVIPLSPSLDCEENQAAIQSALDLAPVHVVLAAGTYCLNEPLTLRSNTVIEGAGDGRLDSPETMLVQNSPATSLFHLKGVWGVTIRDLKIELPKNISQPPANSDCVLNPTLDDRLDDRCLWQRSAGIAAFGTRDIRILNLTIAGGRAGIALLDHPNLEAPSGGPDARLDQLGVNRWAAYYDQCRKNGPGENNLSWRIENNLIEGSGDGLLIFNLSHGEILRNTLRQNISKGKGGTGNGIKIGCGPVIGNRLIANYLHNNGKWGTGDGIDVAWAWTSDPVPDSITDLTAAFPTQEAVLLTVEDGPDGLFKDNLIEGNLAWGNRGNGIAFKVKQGKGCRSYRTDPLYQIGSNVIRRNAAWHNGRGGGASKKNIATTSQLELRCVKPQDGEVMKVEDNIFAARLPRGAGISPTPPASIGASYHGATLDRVWETRYVRNWHSRHVGDWYVSFRSLFGNTGMAWDIYFPRTTSQFTPFAGNRADPERVSPNPPPGLVETLLPPDAATFKSLLNLLTNTDPYHLGDADSDSCSNFCEAMLGRDHLDGDDGLLPCGCNVTP